MKNAHTWTLLVALVAGGAANNGCVVNNDFSPRGIDVSLSGEWDVNGGIPTVQSCGDIDTVRVLICETQTATTCLDVGLEYPCELGAFDTRPTSVLSAGRYYTVWQARDAAGNVLQETDPLLLDVFSQDHAILAIPDFDGAQPTELLARVRFQTEFGGSVYQSCTDANIGSGEFMYSLHEGPSPASPTIVATTNQFCSSGNNVLFTETASFTFDTGDYTIFITASETLTNPTCTTTWVGSCTFNLTLGQSNDLTCDIDIDIDTTTC